jgi:pseudouridine synthase
MPERLHKYLAHCGVASRRKAEDLIAAGHVSVNGEIVTEMGVQVEPGADRVEVDGRPVRPETGVHLVLHKPRGFVSTASDERDRKTVLDLVEGIDERVYPVGRLDRDSEGLLVLTNDGNLAQYLTHPSCEVTKTYRVTVDGYVENETMETIRAGVRIGGRKVVPRRAAILHRNPRLSRIEIEIGEGLNREVRRIFAAVGHEARKLIRTRIGPLTLKGLPRGRARHLTPDELRDLQKGMAAAGLAEAPPAASRSPRPGRTGKKPRGRSGGPKRTGRAPGGSKRAGGKGRSKSGGPKRSGPRTGGAKKSAPRGTKKGGNRGKGRSR